MTLGKNLNTGETYLTLSAEESERFQNGEQITKRSVYAKGEFAITVQMKELALPAERRAALGLNS